MPLHRLFCLDNFWQTLIFVVNYFRLQASPEPVGSVQCDVCKILVGYVDKYIDDNNTEVRAL